MTRSEVVARMSVSSRVIKKKGAGNASLEVLPQDQPTSPKSCDALAQSSKSPAGSALEVLPPETSLSSSMILPPTSPCVAAAAPPKQPGPTGPTASLRKVNTAPVRRIPVTPPKAHPFAPAPGAPRAVTSAGSPGSPAGAGTFNRKRTGRGIQEAKEFCVEMGTGGPLEGGAPGEGDGDGDGGSDGSGEGLDPELLDDLEQSSLLEDPGTPAAAGAGAGPGAPATPRLTARDINTIMDPSTLDFLAKNRDTLSKYMAMERSVASGASSAASTPLSGAPRARPDWAFITRVSQMSRLAASDRDDALTVASVSSAAPSPAASPHPVVVRKASGASSAAPTLASPPSTASVPSQGSALLPEPPKESQFPEGGAKDEAEEAELGSVHPLPDTFDASFSDAHFMDGDSSLCEAGPYSPPGADRASPEAPSGPIAGPPKSFFKPPLKDKRKAKPPPSGGTGPNFLDRNKAMGATARYYTLTDAEETKVKQLLEDPRFESEVLRCVGGPPPASPTGTRPERRPGADGV